MPSSIQCQGSMIKNNWFKILLIFIVAFFVAGATSLTIWTLHLNATIKERLAGKKWRAPSEYYSAPVRILKDQVKISETLVPALDRLGYEEIALRRKLKEGQYKKLLPKMCADVIGLEDEDKIQTCWFLLTNQRQDQPGVEPQPITIVQGVDDSAIALFEGEPPVEKNVIHLEPELMAQFYGGKPILRDIITLGDVPTDLLNAFLAIEDKDFLTHRGVSPTGILRAALRNVLKGGYAQGGSTITQQLVKNYFLTSEKTIKRKITEAIMALLLESQFSKDEILETYVNEIYLGQDGPFEVHGAAVGAKFLFNKKLEDLNLAECALMAGSVKAPNRYNPFRHPQRAIARRELVLQKMKEMGVIDEEQYTEAVSYPLPQPRKKILKDTAPYFIDSVHWQLGQLGLNEIEGLRVFTTLNLLAQRAASEAVPEGIEKLEKQYKFIQENEKKFAQKLQGLLISADLATGYVEAVMGGRGYKETQLNRTLQSKRQVGSIFKPFVYAAAFSSSDENGLPFTPTTQVLDEPYTLKYEGQSWSPKNYGGEYFGEIPLYLGLMKSLNTATSRIAMQVGLANVIETAKNLGVQTDIPAVPSISLGSTDLTPFEVLQAYSSLARNGTRIPLTFIYRALDEEGEVLFDFNPDVETAINPVDASQTIALMEGVINYGTGRGIRLMGFKNPAAGKTGTTSDTKDAWFGGFTPYHAAIVWVGYDRPEEMGLTGGLAAAPIWAKYMLSYGTKYPADEFTLPDGAKKVGISYTPKDKETSECVPLVFKDEDETDNTCSL